MRRATLSWRSGALLGPLALALNGCGDPTAPTENVTYTRIEEVVDLGITGLEAKRLVIGSGESWDAFWNLYTVPFAQPPSQPSIDFHEEQVIIVTPGERAGIGHDIRIARIERHSGAVHIRIIIESPPPSSSCHSASISTTPIEAVRVDRTMLPIVFAESHRILPCPES